MTEGVLSSQLCLHVINNNELMQSAERGSTVKHYTSETVREAAADLLDHGILLLPTDTVYGVGAAYGSLDDLQRLKNIKHRPETKAIPFMVSSVNMMQEIAVMDERSLKIAEKFLPGPLTLILKRDQSVDAAYTNGMETVAVRIPDCQPVIDLIEKTGRPLLVSSANLSGDPAALSSKQAEQALSNADGILEGSCFNQQASTILDCTKEDLQVLREGPLSLQEILEGIAS